MVYDSVIHGKFIDMRSITMEDAEFSYEIRKAPENRETVGQLAESLQKQKEFIAWQMQEPNDYYFVVLNKKGERIGLIGVYNITEEMAEIGREVSYGNPMETEEANVLLEEFCRDYLKLEKISYVIYTNNKRNLSNQKKKGAAPKKIIQRNGVVCAYFEEELCGAFYERVKKMLERIGVEQSD